MKLQFKQWWNRVTSPSLYVKCDLWERILIESAEAKCGNIRKQRALERIARTAKELNQSELEKMALNALNIKTDK